MRVVIQRVARAAVTVQREVVASIGAGLLILLGVEPDDSDEDAEWLAAKIARMRIFDDSKGVMNRSVVEVEGEAMVVSQFTLMASTKRGNRPSFIGAARPEVAVTLYEAFVAQLVLELGRPVPTGRFGAEMEVELVNDGPVTLWMDSKRKE